MHGVIYYHFFSDMIYDENNMLQVKNTTSKGPPPTRTPPSSSTKLEHHLNRTHRHGYCSTVLEFSTHSLADTSNNKIELEHLPLVDILPPTPVCSLADCRFEVGPLCFSQFSGG